MGRPGWRRPSITIDRNSRPTTPTPPAMHQSLGTHTTMPRDGSTSTQAACATATHTRSATPLPAYPHGGLTGFDNSNGDTGRNGTGTSRGSHRGCQHTNRRTRTTTTTAQLDTAETSGCELIARTAMATDTLDGSDAYLDATTRTRTETALQRNHGVRRCVQRRLRRRDASILPCLGELCAPGTIHERIRNPPRQRRRWGPASLTVSDDTAERTPLRSTQTPRDTPTYRHSSATRARRRR